MKRSDDARKTDLAASTQFLMIVLSLVVIILVLVLWHPFQTRPIDGVPKSVVATSGP